MSSRPRPIRRAPAGCAAVGLAVVSLVACHGKSAPSGSASSTAGGGAATGTSAKSGSSASTTVEVKNFAFMPKTLTVRVGTTVTWRFEDSAAHTVDIATGNIVSKPLKSGATYTHTFRQAGTYNYICSIHPYMRGSVVVK